MSVDLIATREAEAQSDFRQILPRVPESGTEKLGLITPQSHSLTGMFCAGAVLAMMAITVYYLMKYVL